MLSWRVNRCLCHRALGIVLTVYPSSPLDSKVGPFPIFLPCTCRKDLRILQ